VDDYQRVLGEISPKQWRAQRPPIINIIIGSKVLTSFVV
jgi:hypothetical protein